MVAFVLALLAVLLGAGIGHRLAGEARQPGDHASLLVGHDEVGDDAGLGLADLADMRPGGRDAGVEEREPPSRRLRPDWLPRSSDSSSRTPSIEPSWPPRRVPAVSRNPSTDSAMMT